MAISDKLQSILDSKAAIKAAIEAKGVADVGDVLSAYAGKIASIPSGGSGFTGHADVEGLKAIGWTDDDIEYYQKHGVNWNEEDDEYHKVPQDNIDLYGVLTIDNIQEYKDRIVYLPKIDTRSVTNMNSKFVTCTSMVSIPMIDTSSVTNFDDMFASCWSLTTIPKLDMSNATSANRMFSSCYSLVNLPVLECSNQISINNMFDYCSCINIINMTMFDNINSANYIFSNCSSLITLIGLNLVNASMNNILSYANSVRCLYISGISSSLDISGINMLSKESLLYIIENAAPTEPITITLSAYCHEKYNADPDVVAALEKQPNISLASA